MNMKYMSITLTMCSPKAVEFKKRIFSYFHHFPGKLFGRYEKPPSRK